MLRKLLQAALLLLLAGSLFIGGCNNMTPVDPQGQQSPASPSKQQTPDATERTITYNYGDTGPVQLSDNNITMNVGQKLILKPAAGLTKNTRFTSNTDNFFGDIMEQQGDPNSGQLVFTAKQPGKGRLQIIPNSTETDRATELWVTVQ